MKHDKRVIHLYSRKADENNFPLIACLLAAQSTLSRSRDARQTLGVNHCFTVQYLTRRSSGAL